MFGAAFVFAVLAVLNIKNVNSYTLSENDVQKILDSLQRELVSEDQIKYVNINEHKKSEKNKNTFFDNIDAKLKEESANVPIYVIDARVRENKLQQNGMLQNVLKELIAHHVRVKNNINNWRDSNRKKSYYRNKLNDLDRYSKLYLIFNMLPEKQKVNEEEMKSITRLLFKKHSHVKQKGKNGPGTYLIKDDALKGRRGAGSDEYSVKYADEEMGEPKRPKHSESGRGRTGIPYIHRYVYEK